MKYYIYFSLFLSIAFFSSCQKKNATNRNNIKPIKLEGITMNIQDPNFVIKRIIDQHNSIIYMESMMSDTLINAYLIKGDSLILSHRFLAKGQGPFEVNIFSSLYDKKQETLSFFENSGTLTKGYIVDLKSKNSVTDKSLWKKLDFTDIEKMTIRYSFAYISDTSLLMIGGKHNSPEILSILNLNDQKTITPLLFWPNDKFDDNTFVKQTVYQDNARLFKNYSSKEYLYVCGEGKYMEIFEISKEEIVNRKIIYEEYPQYEILEDNMNYKNSENSVNHGFYTYVTDNLVYTKPVEYTQDMMRSGKSYKGYDYYYNDVIEVFDWGGNMVKKYELDTPFHSFIVDEKNNIIYTETDDLETGDSIIKKYMLNK